MSKIKATIEKVVRQNGKVNAQVVMTIPAASVPDVPLGMVTITMEPLQVSMFDAKAKEETTTITAKRKR